MFATFQKNLIKAHRFTLTFSFLLLNLNPTLASSYRHGSLSPGNWPPGDLERYSQIDLDWKRPHPLVQTSNGMVLDLLGARAVRAAIETIRQGGNAMDAALLGAMTEITLQAGRMISFAGIMGIAYYDSKERKVYYLNAGYNRPKLELDPKSIPKMGVPSGRSVLVPGFMSGLAEAHHRFGRLPFSALFEPAIYFAENGFVVDARLNWSLLAEKDKILRLEGGQRVFLKDIPNRILYSKGDTFKQPLLTETLKQLSKSGSGYFYRGEWGKKLVAVVQEEGGKLTEDDLKEYRPIWTEPVQTEYKNVKVLSAGLPGLGGVNLVEALNMLSVSKLIETYGDPVHSADSLFWLIQMTRANQLLTFEPEANIFKGVSGNPFDRITMDHAQTLWLEIKKNRAHGVPHQSDPHSSAFIVKDSDGNIAVIEHSINSVGWGASGIFIDGVSIPDSANFQQEPLSRIKPGDRLPDPLSPVICLENGYPVFASAAIGAALHETMVQSFVNIFDLNLDPKTSVDRPMFHYFSTKNWKAQEVSPNQFSQAILDKVRKMGQAIDIADPPNPGLWLGIHLNKSSGLWEGAVTSEKAYSYAEALPNI